MANPGDEASVACWRIVVRGRVQGVGYRESCVDAARAIGVSGWVRNRFDGSVEVLARGPLPQLDRLRAWLRRGPPAAIVDDLEVQPLPPPLPEVDGFERRPSA